MARAGITMSATPTTMTAAASNVRPVTRSASSHHPSSTATTGLMNA